MGTLGPKRVEVQDCRDGKQRLQYFLEDGGRSLLLTGRKVGNPLPGCGNSLVLPITGKTTLFLRQVLM